jgi:hypothetical protein
VYIVPAISAGMAQIQRIVDIITLSMMDDEGKLRVLDEFKEKNPECEMGVEEFVLSRLDDIIVGLMKRGVSIGNRAAFPKASNVRKVQVERCLAYFKELEKVEVGVFPRLSPSLKATQVSAIIKGFVGEGKSYVSNRRDLDKQLFKDFYSSSPANALLNPVRKEVQEKRDRQLTMIDTNDVVLVVKVEGGEEKEFQLMKGSEKTDLATFASTKSNGTRYLDIRSIKLCTEREGNRKSVFRDFWNRPLEYNLASDAGVNPLVNQSTIEYLPGFVTVYKVGDEYDISIPVSERLNITDPKTESAYDLITNLQYSELGYTICPSTDLVQYSSRAWCSRNTQRKSS